MKSFLTALEEGRLIELPEGTKDEALEYLALLIEAIPDIGTGEDIVSDVKARENAASSVLGHGVACPHMRSKKTEGELLCAVGWSPAGIDYGAPDGMKVHLIIMYYIPDSERNVYLKEVSRLAKAIQKTGGIGDIINAHDLSTVRHELLDWIGLALDAAGPDATARMIKLEARQAMASETAAPAEFEPARLPFKVIPFSLVKTPGAKAIVLAQDQSLIDALESGQDLGELAGKENDIKLPGLRILVRSASRYAGNRQIFDCLAVRTE